MTQATSKFSLVTAVLPNSTASRITPALLEQEGTSALSWKARGTLLQDHWFKRWLPPISPTKSVIQMLVPNSEASRLVNSVVAEGRLHQQATGAVFSTPCEQVFFGSNYHLWQARPGSELEAQDEVLTEDLSAIYCIVPPRLSDHVSKAAISAGAHGPVVYYTEGRGLRDRLGWLRITKEHDKEVLMVISDETETEDIFDAMAKAGQLHLPGRGFMYRLKINRGLFNLPSRVSHHHYDANMQQIISAIDHLSGHTHWRDQNGFDVGGEGRGVGIDAAAGVTNRLENQVCVTVMVPRDDCPTVMDALLDAGAPGLNLSYARFAASESTINLAGARVTGEYGMLRCITDAGTADKLCQEVESHSSDAGMNNLCLFTNAVPEVATYVPGSKDFRERPGALLAAG